MNTKSLEFVSGLRHRFPPMVHHLRRWSEVILSREVKLVAYADVMPKVIVSKHLDEISYVFDTTYYNISGLMKSVNLELAEQKTETVLIITRRITENYDVEGGKS
ncbi:hypothetical protein EVAR_22059_1 [Eumeta japonica]|uniref:Uncharacterized protein n=1 Tax=Eumeta variegata TaxID=151549 RepID=A0A4C1UTT9_EUMVA|nr:hypothetical protein EVAR_22059_1 [Eumeta japonica]